MYSNHPLVKNPHRWQNHLLNPGFQAGQDAESRAVIVFEALCSRARQLSSVPSWFRSWDEDRTGFLTPSKFRTGMSRLGFELDDDIVRILWTKFDLDGNGYVDLYEFSTVLSTGEVPSFYKVGVNFFDISGRTFDKNAPDPRPGMKSHYSGLSSAEIADEIYNKLLSKASSSRDLFKFFRLWDEDKNGGISRAELRAGLKSLDFYTSEEVLDILMARFDQDQGGTIDYKEFVKIVRPKPEELGDSEHLTLVTSPSKSHVTRVLASIWRNFPDGGPAVLAPHFGQVPENSSGFINSDMFRANLIRFDLAKPSDIDVIFNSGKYLVAGLVNYQAFIEDCARAGTDAPSSGPPRRRPNFSPFEANNPDPLPDRQESIRKFSNSPVHMNRRTESNMSTRSDYHQDHGSSRSPWYQRGHPLRHSLGETPTHPDKHGASMKSLLAPADVPHMYASENERLVKKQDDLYLEDVQNEKMSNERVKQGRRSRNQATQRQYVGSMEQNAAEDELRLQTRVELFRKQQTWYEGVNHQTYFKKR